MNKIERYLQDTFKEVQKLQKESEKAIREEDSKSNKMSKFHRKTKDKHYLGMAIVYSNNSLIYHDIKRLSILLQMHMAVVGMMNATLQKVVQKYPEIKSELEQNIGKKLDPLIQKFLEGKEIEDDINTKAKNREDKLGGMFG